MLLILFHISAGIYISGNRPMSFRGGNMKWAREKEERQNEKGKLKPKGCFEERGKNHLWRGGECGFGTNT
jgi:hypothetical protein